MIVYIGYVIGCAVCFVFGARVGFDYVNHKQTNLYRLAMAQKRRGDAWESRYREVAKQLEDYETYGRYDQNADYDTPDDSEENTDEI